MINKHYIPDLEEFHVGFEYQNYSKLTERWIEQMSSFSINQSLDSIRLHLKDKTLRVKYLDKEDIESLGFIQEATYSFVNKEKDIYIEVLLEDLKLGKDTLDIFVSCDCRFKGIVKNRLELKKLLKQLDIL